MKKLVVQGNITKTFRQLQTKGYYYNTSEYVSCHSLPTFDIRRTKFTLKMSVSTNCVFSLKKSSIIVKLIKISN